MSKIKVVSTIRPCVFRSPVTGRLQIAGGTVLLVNGAAPASAWPKVPEGTTVDTIEWSAPAPKAVKPSAAKTYTVEGRGGTYTVTVAGTRVTCTCPGYTFRRTCKHTKAVKL